jgi:hypothetical protein
MHGVDHYPVCCVVLLTQSLRVASLDRIRTRQMARSVDRCIRGIQDAAGVVAG